MQVPEQSFLKPATGVTMLWSQSLAIFANFRRKIGVFLKNQCYDHILSKN
jgi:hypothetical protein